MNDNEIIKGFAVCNDLENGACEKCPYDRGVYDNSCLDDMKTDVYNLINRQKVEIERLKGMVSQNEGVLPQYESLVRAEAIKEFAEMLKNSMVIKLDRKFYFPIIDNLVKEMTEGTQ